MANKNKAKGTRAESRVVKELQANGIEAERRALHGNKDEGDVLVTMPDGEKRILEVKAGKMTYNPSRSQLNEWLDQTRIEEIYSGMRGALVVVRYRRSLKDADVYIQHRIDRDYIVVEHMYFDDLIAWIKK